MKNRFGFIPIVLPVLVMVLIIGLINLGGPQSAQAQLAADDPQLTTLVVTPRVDLTRPDGEDDFESASTTYSGSVPYQVDSTTVVATAANDMRVEWKSRVATSTVAGQAYSADVDLNVGPNTIKLKVRSTVNTALYSDYTVTLTRQKPRLSALTVKEAVGADPEADTGDSVALTRPDDLAGFASASTTYDAMVDYDVASTTVQVTADDFDSTRVEFSGVPVASSTSDVSSGTYNAVVNLRVGDNNIRIKAKGADSPSEYETYTVRLKRNKPMLTGLELDVSPGDAIFGGDGTAVSRHGPQNASTTAAGTLVGNPDSTGFIVTTTRYTAAVEYTRDSVRVVPVPGDMVVVEYRGARDADGGTGAFDMNLAQGSNTVTVRAKSSKTSTHYTDYPLTVMRESTPLTGITLANPSPDMMSKATGGAMFDAAMHTMAYASVEYEQTSIDVSAMANPGTVIKLMRGGQFIASSSDSLSATTTDLMVGSNSFDIEASIEGNKQTYSLMVTRMQPTPTLNFTLLDSSDEVISSGNHILTLGPQSKSYNLVVEVPDITYDHLLVASSIQMRVQPKLPDLMGASGGSRSGVKVSINGVTVPDDGSNISVDLSEGANTLEFDVNYETGDTSDPMDISTHRVLIERRGNSVPRFPTNHSLRGKEIVVVKNMAITPTYELPFANGGNGALMYKLEGDEARGTARTLPTSLYTLPTGEGSDGMNGRLNTAPDLTGDGDVSYYYLVLSVSDSDAITRSSDEDTLRFTIKVVRDPKQVPPTTTTPRAKGDLIDLRVLRVGTTVKYPLKPPTFVGTTYSYTVELPTDIDTADVEAVAATGAMVTLEGTHTSMRAAEGEGTRHEWNAFQIYRGGAATVRNVYDVVVTEDGTSKTYRLTVTRKADIPPTFSDNSKIMREYYDDIPVSDLSKEFSELPAAVKDSGNGALMYSFKRRAANLPTVVPNDFLGLVPDLTDIPKLTGTPSVDGSVSTRHADRSEVLASYTVIDSDDNTADSDSASIDVDIIVYRNVALQSYTVDGVRKSDLDTSTREYRSTRAYRYDDTDIKEYTFNVSHSVSMVTFEAAAYDTARASVSYLPADADASKDGHQINVGSGDNEVAVTVSNGGAISATHVINLRKPGLQLLDVTVTEDEDARDGGSLTDGVPLKQTDDMTKGFDREVLDYTASVETWVRSVQVMAVPSDPSATVFVNDFEVADPPGYSVVDLTVGENTITLGASINQQVADSSYMITLTRESDDPPSFGTAMFADITRMVGSSVSDDPCKMITLPPAVKDSGNGALTYSVNMEQLPPGLDFDAATRMITGTPTLDEGYSSDFNIVYTVSDEDGNSAASDTDTLEFTITITHDPNAACTATPPDAAARPNQLSELVVTYDRGGVMGKVAALNPMFMSDNSGPYTAEIPTDATNVQVTAVRAAPAAVISMNNVRIDSGQKIVLPPTATIKVRHSGHPEMTYTLNTNRVANTDPVFSGSVEDMTFVSGQAIEDPVELPAATGGNGTLMYSLMDHEGNTPDGLVFTAATRMLSGTPTLVRDADDTMYRMTYTATDENGDTDTLNFNIRVCDASVQGCAVTEPEPNPGSTPMDLMVTRSGSSATITWRPGDDAAMQIVVATQGTSATLQYMVVAGDADSHMFSDLQDGTYRFAVIGLDANGSYGSQGNYYVMVVMQ